ncbi:MAG: hypothetical protein V4467_02280 [Patescibacteria group bacterium]
MNEEFKKIVTRAQEVSMSGREKEIMFGKIVEFVENHPAAAPTESRANEISKFWNRYGVLKVFDSFQRSIKLKFFLLLLHLEIFPSKD